MRKLLWMLALVPACTNDNVTSDKACTDYAAAFCGKLQSCAPVLVSGLYADVTTCQARAKIGCMAALSAPGTTTTPNKLDDCAHALMPLGCDVVFQRTPPTACIPAAGPLADGMACGDDGQCHSGYCRKAPGMTCGTCGPTGAAGATCARDEDCNAQLKCQNAKCAALVAPGGTCDADTPCLPPSVCAGSNVCTTPGALGAACDMTHPCDFLQAQYCDPKSKTCVAVTLASSGVACGMINGAFVACAGSSQCLMDAKTGTKSCSAVAPDGTSCDLTTGPTCLSPAECLNGVCHLPNAAACQ
jgi:hypothetical protein